MAIVKPVENTYKENHINFSTLSKKQSYKKMRKTSQLKKKKTVSMWTNFSY